MKLKEREAKSTFKDRQFYLGYIGVVTLVNLGINPLLEHLNKRGVFTMYWVLNDDDEVRHVVSKTKAQGVMTDRP